MSSLPLRSLRLQKRAAASLDRLSGNSGELFYDADNGTLRLYTGDGADRIIFATRTWVNQIISTESFSGSYNDLTDLPVLFSGSYNDLTDLPTIPSLTGLATETFVTTAISSLVDTAPATLDTLNELAAALNDDANFATTVSTALGLKAPLADPTFTGTVGGVTATMVGLGNVTNESKATMFTSPAFTGTPTGITATHVGLGNVTNESKATMFTSPTFTGTITLQQSVEILNTITGATGTVEHNFSTGAIWYHSTPVANFTANFTNIPTTNNRTISVVLIIDQGDTAYLPTAVQLNGAAQTINWSGATVPTGNASQVDTVSFTFIRTSDSWTVIGSLTSYG